MSCALQGRRARSMPYDDECSAPVVIIGSGAAGLTTALELADVHPVIVSKLSLGSGGSTAWAQGGIAASLGANDTPQRHADDTLAVSARLADTAIVEHLTTHAPRRVGVLQRLGVSFDRENNHALRLAREAGHSASRVVSALGDQIGPTLLQTLSAAIRRDDRIATLMRHEALDLAVDEDGVHGVYLRQPNGAVLLLRSSKVILATGGIGGLYRHTTNPPEVTGDGLGMALRAGADLTDLEFVQFHPTALKAPRDPLRLLTEAIRGEGATLVDKAGHRFMQKIHPSQELAPRDVVARAIWSKMRYGPVFLDATKALGSHFSTRFPAVNRYCREQGLDPSCDRLPVTPAAHYHMGGVLADRSGQTSVDGLWAVGEVACTGAHGANRLASNSLLEAVVFAESVALSVRSQPARKVRRPCSPSTTAGRQLTSDEQETALIASVRDLMWMNVGLRRDEAGLTSALTQLESLAERAVHHSGKLRSIIDVATAVTLFARERCESRGAHYRSDFPQTLGDPRYRLRFSLSEGLRKIWIDKPAQSEFRIPKATLH